MAPIVEGYAALRDFLSGAMSLAELPYDAVTGLYGPVFLTITAVDAAGNRAEPVRQAVYITASGLCADGERLCVEGGCSYGGVCFSAAALALLTPSAAPALAQEPVVDTHVPVITVLVRPTRASEAERRRPYESAMGGRCPRDACFQIISIVLLG